MSNRVDQYPFAKECFKIVVDFFGQYYGYENVSYSVHSLIHLMDDAENLGSLDEFSAFPFESYLGNLKKLFGGPSNYLQQLSSRLFERESLDETEELNSPLLKQEHSTGPLPESITVHFKQYSMFSVVEFHKDSSVELVPFAWISGDQTTCKRHDKSTNLTRWIEAGIKPQATWGTCVLKQVGRKKRNKYLDTSNIDSSSDDEVSCRQLWKKVKTSTTTEPFDVGFKLVAVDNVSNIEENSASINSISETYLELPMPSLKTPVSSRPSCSFTVSNNYSPVSQSVNDRGSSAFEILMMRKLEKL
ncbi:unnamed protein product [Allacma fusca]|uniref:Uncharacterized protein n=1 Tax=Allacma fusca TaxID=39272 RepID=A0A8J2PDB8_9HEXA|nr:unnamed protein product [Allacma fusca]